MSRSRPSYLARHAVTGSPPVGASGDRRAAVVFSTRVVFIHRDLPMRILKFGGSSVATPERLRRVAELVARRPRTARSSSWSPPSAGSRTSWSGRSKAAAARNGGWEGVHAGLRERHLAAARELGATRCAPGSSSSSGTCTICSTASPAAGGQRADPGRGALLRRAMLGRARRGGARRRRSSGPGGRCAADRVTDASFGRARVDLEATRENARAILLPLLGLPPLGAPPPGAPLPVRRSRWSPASSAPLPRAGRRPWAGAARTRPRRSSAPSSTRRRSSCGPMSTA
jgi:hypothetical protein